MSRRAPRGYWFAAYLVVCGLIAGGLLLFIGYATAAESGAAERCAALGAVAVEGAGDRWVCVEEVIP